MFCLLNFNQHRPMASTFIYGRKEQLKKKRNGFLWFCACLFNCKIVKVNYHLAQSLALSLQIYKSFNWNSSTLCEHKVRPIIIYLAEQRPFQSVHFCPIWLHLVLYHCCIFCHCRKIPIFI